MKILEKFIASIVIIGLILSLGLNLMIFKPRKAQAFLGIEDTMHDIIVEIKQIWEGIKEFGLDKAARFIARMAMNRLRESLIRWAQGGFRDDNQPLSITNWRNFFHEAFDLASAKFIQELNLTSLCRPFQYSLGERLGLAGHPYDTLPYQEYAACTIDTLIYNAEEFIRHPNITIYGWDTWTALTQPQNNFLGSAILAFERQSEIAEEEKEAAQAEGQAGQGYRNENECMKDMLEACDDGCYENSVDEGELEMCLENCQRTTPPGICVEYRTKNIGSTVYATIEKTVGSDIDWLISAHEFTDLVEIMTSALLNKVMFSLGIAGGSYRPTTQQQYREQYSYHQITKKMLTPQKIYQTRSKTLSRILNAIQSMNRSIRTCEASTAINISMVARSYDEVLEQESQALYSEIERIDLQPDYEVLDPINAPPNLVVYGYSWQNISSTKYPQKCRDIIKESGLAFGSTCSDISSGLPPVSQNPQCECIFDHNHHNCPPAPYPTIPFNQIRNVWTLALDQAKASFYNTCMATYNDVVNRCNECLKKAETECEQMVEADERINCINQVCNNYGTIAGVIDAQDFYNKCLIEERKTSCYTCVKEYFMPADYCSLTGDYIARATVKYPGTFRKVEKAPALFLGLIGLFWQMDWLAPDKVGWIGIKEPNQCPDSVAHPSAQTTVDLICRIEPDFTLAGTNICRTYCPFTADFTQEMLYDINDDKPNDRDCNYQLTRTGGMPGIWVVENGASENKGKCCRVFKGHKPEDYAACGGQASQAPPRCTYAVAVDREPWCYCGNGWRPVGFARTGDPQTIGDRGGDCHSFGFDTDGRQLLVYTNNNPDSDTYYIARGECSEDNERCNDTDPQNNDPENNCVGAKPTDAQEPGGAVWTAVPSGRTKWCPDIDRGNYNAGVYHNDNNDIKSGIHLCAKCLPGEDPTYGTGLDQCYDKEPGLSWLEDCP